MKKKKQNQNVLAQVLTQETPAKVVGLLAASLFSLALMFTVTASEASFSGPQIALRSPFSPEAVVGTVDKVAAAYSSFVSENFLQPLSADYAVYADNASWIFQESGLAYALGVEGLMDSSSSQPISSGQVAGAYKLQESSIYSQGSFNVDTLYSALIGQ